jgi:hypothetical protein
MRGGRAASAIVSLPGKAAILCDKHAIKRGLYAAETAFEGSPGLLRLNRAG